MPFTIRRAMQTDAEKLAELRIAFLQGLEEIDEGPQRDTLQVATFQYFSEKIPREGFVSWIAEDEGEIVGASGMMYFERPPSVHNPLGKEAYILNMYTLPEYRRKGIGTRLLQELLTEAKQAGVRRIWLHATEDGRPVYEKAGFVAKKREMLEMELVW